MAQKIIGYDGPVGPYCVVDGKLLPLFGPEGMVVLGALADAATLTQQILGPPAPDDE